MITLEQLREKNSIAIHTVDEPLFAQYGEVLSLDSDAVVEALKGTPMPPERNLYVASDENMEKLDATKQMTWDIYGGLPAQLGYCNGYNVALGAMEWHDCSEVDIAGTPLVLLLAKYSDIKDDVLDSKDVVAFYLPTGTAVRLFPQVLHFAPCSVADDGFKCAIGLSKGTNGDLSPELVKQHSPLKALNKWMLAHPERADLIAGGAKEGIVGENYIIKH